MAESGRVGALIELDAGFSAILTARENIYVNGAVLGFTRPRHPKNSCMVL
jgi:ABC-type polysaccharide/polyol phosphate transport system ATPase subunit